MGYFYSPSLARKIARELSTERYDLIFVHCSSVAQYVAHVKGIPKVLDFGDMDSQKWLDYSRVKPFPLNMGYWLEGKKMERAEKHLANNFDYCTCTTKAEKETLDGFSCKSPTAWFPNGVDHNYFQPTSEPYVPDTLCFIGRMDYFPNQECIKEFCVNSLPLIRARRPNATLTIIGANPSAEVLKLGEMAGVSVTGSVADVRPYVLRSAVNVAPLNIARGTQNKILESLAMGVPVVSSNKAAGGIDAVPGEHLLTASDAEGYAAAVLRLLENPEERSRFAISGRERVLEKHDWSKSMSRLDAILEECLDAAGGQGQPAQAISED
jgi:sugar transferase (PEP-CTERM/EpsH1 system associated)